MKLIKPNDEYRKQYLEGVHSLIKEDMYPDISDEIALSSVFSPTLDKYGEEDGVYRSHFWLVEDDRWLGMITIRHTPTTHEDFPQELANQIYYNIHPKDQGKGYGTEILRLGLKEAKKLGFKEVCVACNEDNIKSRKVIERNGGILVHDLYVPLIKQNIRNYKIELD